MGINQSFFKNSQTTLPSPIIIDKQHEEKHGMINSTQKCSDLLISSKIQNNLSNHSFVPNCNIPEEIFTIKNQVIRNFYQVNKPSNDFSLQNKSHQSDLKISQNYITNTIYSSISEEQIQQMIKLKNQKQRSHRNSIESQVNEEPSKKKIILSQNSYRNEGIPSYDTNEKAYMSSPD